MTPEHIFTSLGNALIGQPGRFTTTVGTERGTKVIIADVEQAEQGKIIGGGGGNVEALRLVIALCGRKTGHPHGLRIVEKERQHNEPMPFIPNLDWQPSWLQEIAQQTADAMFLKPARAEVTDTDDGRTRLLFIISGAEPRPVPDTSVETALTNLFRGIGYANGRKVNVSLRRV